MEIMYAVDGSLITSYIASQICKQEKKLHLEKEPGAFKCSMKKLRLLVIGIIRLQVK